MPSVHSPTSATKLLSPSFSLSNLLLSVSHSSSASCKKVTSARSTLLFDTGVGVREEERDNFDGRAEEVVRETAVGLRTTNLDWVGSAVRRWRRVMVEVSSVSRRFWSCCCHEAEEERAEGQ